MQNTRLLMLDHDLGPEIDMLRGSVRDFAEATSVVMYEVTPSSRLEGMKASAIHSPCARQCPTGLVVVVMPMAAGLSP